MNRRRRRPNYFGWVIFGLVVLFGYYFNRVYLPSTPLLAGPTLTATHSPEAYKTEAEQLFNEGKLTQAIESYKAAISASPQDPSLYVGLARIQVWAGQPEEAQKNAEYALLLNNTNAMAHAVHAWALDWQDGKNGEALEAIDEALKLDPNNAVIQAYYVEILVDSGFDNLEKAIDVSRVALALDPNIVETHRARGYLLNATNTDGTNIELAIREYDEALKINKNLALLYMEQGQNYRAISAKDEAVQAFTTAITLNPTDPEPSYLISRTYSTFGEYSKALQYAESAVGVSPGDASLRGNLGVMYYRNFDYDNALSELGFAIFGGTTLEGVEITGIPLSNNQLVTEYYFTFGLALARKNRCGEALKIVQELQSRVSTNEVAMEAANRTMDTPTIPVEAPTNPVETETPVPTP
jgi:tetratricopeptide (TPR) repeat protein